MQGCDDLAGECSNSSVNRLSTPKSILRRVTPESSSSVEGTERKRVSFDEESLRVEKTHLTSSSSGPVGRLSKRAGILRRTKGGVNVRGASAGPLLGSSVQALDLSVAGGHSPPSAAIHDGKINGKARRTTGGGTWNWSHARPPVGAGGEPNSSVTALQALTRSGTGGGSIGPGASSSRGRRMFQMQEAKNRAAKMVAAASATATVGTLLAERTTTVAATRRAEGKGEYWEAGGSLRERSPASTAPWSGSPSGSPAEMWAESPSDSSTESLSGSSICTSPSSSAGSPSGSQSQSLSGSTSESVTPTTAPPPIVQQHRVVPRLKSISLSPSPSLPSSSRRPHAPVDDVSSSGGVQTDGGSGQKGSTGSCSPLLVPSEQRNFGATAATAMVEVENTKCASLPPKHTLPTEAKAKQRRSASQDSGHESDIVVAFSSSASPPPPPPPLSVAVSEHVDEGEQRNARRLEKYGDEMRDTDDSPCEGISTEQCQDEMMPTTTGTSFASLADDAQAFGPSAESFTRKADEKLMTAAGCGVGKPSTASAAAVEETAVVPTAEDGQTSVVVVVTCEMESLSEQEQAKVYEDKGLNPIVADKMRQEREEVDGGGSRLQQDSVAGEQDTEEEQEANYDVASKVDLAAEGRLGSIRNATDSDRSSKSTPTVFLSPPSVRSRRAREPVSVLASTTRVAKLDDTASRSTPSRTRRLRQLATTIVTPSSEASPTSSLPSCTPPNRSSRTRASDLADGSSNIDDDGIANNGPFGYNSDSADCGGEAGTDRTRRRRRRKVVRSSEEVCTTSWESPSPSTRTATTTSARRRGRSAAPSLAAPAVSSSSASPKVALDTSVPSEPSAQPALSGMARGAVVGSADGTVDVVRDGELKPLRRSLRVMACGGDNDNDSVVVAVPTPAVAEVGEGAQSVVDAECDVGGTARVQKSRLGLSEVLDVLRPSSPLRATSSERTMARLIEDEADEGTCTDDADPRKKRQHLSPVQLPKRSLSPTVPQMSATNSVPRATRSQRRAGQTRSALTSTTATTTRNQESGSSKACGGGGVSSRRHRNIGQEQPSEELGLAEKNPQARTVPDPTDEEQEDPSWEDVPLVKLLRADSMDEEQNGTSWEDVPLMTLLRPDSMDKEQEKPSSEKKEPSWENVPLSKLLRSDPEDEEQEEPSSEEKYPSWEDLPLMEVLRRRKKMQAEATGNGEKRPQRNVHSSRKLRSASGGEDKSADSGNSVTCSSGKRGDVRKGNVESPGRRKTPSAAGGEQSTPAVERGRTRQQRARRREEIAERGVAAVVVPTPGVLSDAVPMDTIPTVQPIQSEHVDGKRKRGEPQQEQQQQALEEKEPSEGPAQREKSGDDGDHNEAVTSSKPSPAHQTVTKERSGTPAVRREAPESKGDSLPHHGDKSNDGTCQPVSKRQRLRVTPTAAAARPRRTTARSPASVGVETWRIGANDGDNKVADRAGARRVPKQGHPSSAVAAAPMVCGEEADDKSSNILREEESQSRVEKEGGSLSGESCGVPAAAAVVPVVNGIKGGQDETGVASCYIEIATTVGGDSTTRSVTCEICATTNAAAAAAMSISPPSPSAFGEDDEVRGWMRLACSHVPASPEQQEIATPLAAAAEPSEAVAVAATGENALYSRKRPGEEDVSAPGNGAAAVRGWLAPVWTILTTGRGR